jgi:hypothetical protein
LPAETDKLADAQGASGEFMSQKKPGAKKYKGVRREGKKQG